MRLQTIIVSAQGALPLILQAHNQPLLMLQALLKMSIRARTQLPTTCRNQRKVVLSVQISQSLQHPLITLTVQQNCQLVFCPAMDQLAWHRAD